MESNKDISTEKRKSVRINGVFPVQLKAEKPRTNILSSICANTVNISEGGLSISLNLPLPFSSIVSLQIDFSSDYSLTSEKAEVVWSTRTAGNKFRSGIRFLELEDDRLSRLRKVIDETSMLQSKSEAKQERKTAQLEIRQATSEDIDELLRVEEKAWPKSLRATRSMIKSRLETFPEGFLCATVEGKIKGFVVTETLNYDIEKDSFSWGEITDYGFIRKSHNPDGDTIYGVSLTVSPSSPKKTAKLLLEAVGKFAIKHNYKQIVLGCRIPRYYKYADDMFEEDYIQAKTNTGRPLDPELAMYQKEGLRVVKMIMNYIEDPESLNNGILLVWENPFFNLKNTLRFWENYKQQSLFKHKADSKHRLEEKEILAIAEEFGISFSRCDRTFDSREKKTITRWILLLPGLGCSWAKKEGGGCLMCGGPSLIEQITQGRAFSAKDIMQIYDLGRSFLKEEPENLTVYNAGSFLNDNEIPLEVQLEICNNIKKTPQLKTLFVESRPEFITEEKINLLVPNLGSKRLVVGIGLECVDDFIREKYINKGISRKDYERAVRVLKNNGAEALTYVFIKPLYLSERESIDEAINTAKYAFGVGTDEVVFESAFVQRGTEMEKVYNNGKFRPPWLWSIIEVLKATHQLGSIRVGDFTDEPPPIATPYNCEKCSRKIEELFQRYKEFHQIGLFDNLDCKCRKDWLKALDEKKGKGC